MRTPERPCARARRRENAVRGTRVVAWPRSLAAMLRRDVLELGAVAALGAAARAIAGPTRLMIQGERPQELATPLAAFDRLETPTELFFIRSHFGPPALDPKRRVKIGGLVKHPLDLAVADLARFAQVT